ncbi:DUF4554 domain-containing protein [Myxocyprinus asiaticus]|uniref:DUF4554 domain-containing protein n=1 Tax=Myxocyprinus asiaticus TaxID=70543 RepID=UPI0022230520|nr:DUF4554 domain-containing protein [Myxocyprinus asiaticus]
MANVVSVNGHVEYLPLVLGVARFLRVLFKASSQSVEADQSKMLKFLHRLSLVHSRVKIIFKIWTDSKTHLQIFSGEPGSKVLVMDHSVTMDTAAYGQSVLIPFSVWCLPSCPYMHPVLGDTFSCQLPPDTIEAGLCGEMSMATMATLAPCVDQYPNWPTRLSCIRMVVYSPSGMPLTQMSFLQSLATSLSWGDLGLSKVSCTEAQTIQGTLCSEIEFSVETDHNQATESGCSGAVPQNMEPEWSRAVEQTLTLFIFTQYSDPFHSQLFDFISSEEVLERELDAVLWNNGDQVRTALQSTLKNTLKGFQKRQTNRQRLDSALSIVLSSVNCIVTSSTSAEFRRVCLDSMKVKSTCELRISLQQSLQNITDSRFAPRRMCNNDKVAEAVSSEHSSFESWEEAFEYSPEQSPKRIHSDLESSCIIPKKRPCLELSESSDALMSSVFDAPNIQRSPLSPIQLSQSLQTEKIQDVPSVCCLRLAKMRNEQVEKQWLQELENFSEWD